MFPRLLTFNQPFFAILVMNVRIVRLARTVFEPVLLAGDESELLSGFGRVKEGACEQSRRQVIPLLVSREFHTAYSGSSLPGACAEQGRRQHQVPRDFNVE